MATASPNFRMHSQTTSHQPGTTGRSLEVNPVCFICSNQHLPNVIYSVAAGHLWFRRDVLSSYVKQTRVELRKCSSSYHKFTTREKQITDLLLQDLPNR